MTVLLVGLGDLGGVVLEFLARRGSIRRIVAGSRNVERGRARCNLARLGAVAEGRDPCIEFVELDIADPESVARTVHRCRPDVVLSTATLQTWWLPNLLPPETSARLRQAGYGMWLPIHLTLSMKLLRALEDSSYRGVTLTAPYPDVIHPVLARLGLAPTCGVGNVAEIAPKVRQLAAERLRAPIDAIDVFLVAHHSMVSATYAEEPGTLPPHFLRVEHRGRDVTEDAGAREILASPCPLPPGPTTHFLTASTIVELIKAFSSPVPVRLHAPAPNGLPGGYPVVVSRQGVEVAAVDGLTIDEAIEINERAQVFDGIERIEDDGTVVYAPSGVEIFRQVLGYDCARLAPADAEERASELMARFDELAKRHGVSL